MGWLKNVFKSLSDAGGVVTQTEASEAELKEFLEANGENTSSARVSALEKGLEADRAKLLKRLQTETTKKSETKTVKSKQNNKEEREM